jgi:hypothetical protein
MYQCEGMIEKNRDALPELIMTCFHESEARLVRELMLERPQGFKAQAERRASKRVLQTPGNAKMQRGLSRKATKKAAKAAAHKMKKQATVGMHFTESLKLLMAKMNPCQPHFVRCIKPNSRAAPRAYEAEFVMAQLRYSGMLATVKVRREGFASRPTFEEFLMRYGIIAFGLDKVKPNAANCEVVLQRLRLSEYQMGKTKVFLKYYHADKLSARLVAISASAVVIQKNVRRFLAVRDYARLCMQYNIEQTSATNFFKDMAVFALQFHNTLMVRCSAFEFFSNLATLTLALPSLLRRSSKTRTWGALTRASARKRPRCLMATRRYRERPSVSQRETQSHTHSHIQTNTHAHIYSLSLTHSLSLAHTHTHTHTHSLTHTHSRIRSSRTSTRKSTSVRWTASDKSLCGGSERRSCRAAL